MKSTLILTVILAASCQSAMPNRVGLAAGYGEGDIDHDKNTTADYNTNRWWIMPYLEWDLQAARYHRENREDARRLEMTIASGALQPLPAADADDDSGDGSAIGELTDAFTTVPESKDEAWTLLIFAGVFVFLAVAAAIVHLSGVNLPILGRLMGRGKGQGADVEVVVVEPESE